VIFYSLIQLPLKKFLRLIKAVLLSSFFVAVWGIAEHFGIDASYWVQDVKARVFSTLGQPNWLAGYLVMVLPWSLAFYFQTQKKWELVLLVILNLTLYTCFIFTFSRGGDFGLTAAVISLLILIGWKMVRSHLRRVLIISLIFGTITIIFTSPLTNLLFGQTSHRDAPLLQRGDDTGSIRLIIWQDAWEIFKHYPLTGSGLETFGESFYKFRPAEMNQTPEWDFLFNRAHNEYLNFMATTGIIGTLAYLGLLGSFFYLVWLKIKHLPTKERLFLAAATGSTVGYLVQNIFSFTVVPLALVLVMNLAAVTVLIPAKPLSWNWAERWGMFMKHQVQLLLLLPLIIVLVLITNLWRADILHASGSSNYDLGASFEAERDLSSALNLNPTEPAYMMQLALTKASLAIGFPGTADSISEADQAVKLADSAVQVSPYNLNLWRQRAEVLQRLDTINPRYTNLALAARIKATELAPTDPKVRTELAQSYLSTKKTSEALSTFLASYRLKEDYVDTLIGLSRIYLNQSDQEQAKFYLRKALVVSPQNSEVTALAQKAGL
jgi:O-antigen ligase/Flp pilus assembly protein TadD